MFTPSDIQPRTEEELRKILDLLDSPLVAKNLVNASTALCHRETQIKILIPGDKITKSGTSYKLIEGRALLQTDTSPGLGIEVPCFVASGHWDRIRNRGQGEVDLVKHFDDLLPEQGVGLFTCQNGIQNSLEDCATMCGAVTGNLEELKRKALVIGLYNDTAGKIWGLPKDLYNLPASWLEKAPSILSLRQLFVTFGGVLRKIRPYLRWAHVAHSQGGLFASLCLTARHWGLTEEQKGWTKKHLITMVYGGVACVPDADVVEAINTYSTEDIAFRFGKPYLDKKLLPNNLTADEMVSIHTALHPDLSKEDIEAYRKVIESKYITEYPYKSKKNGYSVTVAKCIIDSVPVIQGDHEFMGKTYQAALKRDILHLNKDYEILA